GGGVTGVTLVPGIGTDRGHHRGGRTGRAEHQPVARRDADRVQQPGGGTASCGDDGRGIRNGMQPDLDALADTLDEAANLQLFMGNWGELEALVRRAVEQAVAFKQARIDVLPLSDASLGQVREALTTTQRKLASLAARAEDMANRG